MAKKKGMKLGQGSPASVTQERSQPPQERKSMAPRKGEMAHHEKPADKLKRILDGKK